MSEPRKPTLCTIPTGQGESLRGSADSVMRPLRSYQVCRLEPHARLLLLTR
jgi:hypothetical protein